MPKQVYPGGPGTLPIGSSRMASIFKCLHFWKLGRWNHISDGNTALHTFQSYNLILKGRSVLFSGLLNPGKKGRNLRNQQYTVNFSLLRADKLSIAFVGITRRHRHETLLRL